MIQNVVKIKKFNVVGKSKKNIRDLDQENKRVRIYKNKVNVQNEKEIVKRIK